MQVVNAFLCSSIWGAISHGYSYRPLVGDIRWIIDCVG